MTKRLSDKKRLYNKRKKWWKDNIVKWLYDKDIIC